MQFPRFSYNLSRPYPYRWFTPCVIVGTIILTILFSFVNLAANGYYMKTVYTSDPNTTIKEGQKWFLKAPFNWGSRLDPSCAPRLIAVGDQLFTTNLGFTWAVTSLSQTSSDKPQGSVSLPSVPYVNNTLENCHMQSIDITLIKADLQAPPTWWISWTPSYCTTKVVCTVASELGYANITVQSTYQTGGDSSHNYVIEDDYTTHASTWWGVELLNAYWIGLEAIMSLMVPSGDVDEGKIMRGDLSYSWNNTENKSIRDLDFFGFTFYLLAANSGIDNGYSNLIEMYNDRNDSLSYLAHEGLQFAKIMHSLLTIDFGNAAIPSYLTNKDDLQYLLAAPDDPNRQPGGALYQNPSLAGWNLMAELPPPANIVNTSSNDWVAITDSYDAYAPLVGPLGTKPATFYSQYACSVPAQRGTGTMLLAILIADLVFLQAAWKIVTVVTDAVLMRQDPTAMNCERCGRGEYQEIELAGVASALPFDSAYRRSGKVSRVVSSSSEVSEVLLPPTRLSR